jgi:predicted acetyltransferase
VDYEAWVGVAMDYLNSYATESDRHIFALKHSGVPIGFALVNKHLHFNSDGIAIAEFYIDKQHQAKGCGRELAECVFSHFPGQWEVAVTHGNENAQSFWRRVITDYIRGECREWKIDSCDGIGFSFDNR